MLAVKRVNGVPTVFPADSGEVAAHEDMLEVVWDSGPVQVSTLHTNFPASLMPLPRRECWCCLAVVARGLDAGTDPASQRTLWACGGFMLGPTLRPVGAALLQGKKWESFDALRRRVASEWGALPRMAPVISDSLQAKIQQRLTETA